MAPQEWWRAPRIEHGSRTACLLLLGEGDLPGESQARAGAARLLLDLGAARTFYQMAVACRLEPLWVGLTRPSEHSSLACLEERDELGEAADSHSSVAHRGIQERSRDIGQY